MPSGARRHFAREPCRAASGDDYIAGSLRSAPARSARSAFAVQLRPRFADAPASGIYSHRPIQVACDTQRFVRRLGGGPAVMHSARGAFTTLGMVLFCGPAPIANPPLRPIKANATKCSAEKKSPLHRDFSLIQSQFVFFDE